MSHEVDECYAIYNERVRRARKNHDCDACERIIRRGDLYCYAFWLFDGDLGDGETWPNEELNCGESYEGHWGEPPPNVAALESTQKPKGET